jgi:hypothetical protein
MAPGSAVRDACRQQTMHIESLKICFENMNMVFRSEAALLGFWEYMFRIFVTVCRA